MKKLFLLFTFLISLNAFSQELSLDYKEYSYSQFFKMIEEEKDSVFKLNNALIIYNKKTDQRFSYNLNINTNEVLDIDSVSTISVNKHVELNNVHFQIRYAERVNENVSVMNGGLTKIHFNKSLNIKNIASLSMYNCIVNGTFFSQSFQVCTLSKTFLRSKDFFSGIEIHNSNFNHKFVFVKNCSDKDSTLDFDIAISNNSFNLTKNTQNFVLYILDNRRIEFKNNKLISNSEVYFGLQKTSSITFNSNEFSFQNMAMIIQDQKSYIEIQGNTFNKPVKLRIDALKTQDQIDWTQFKNKLFSLAARGSLRDQLFEQGLSRSYVNSDKFNTMYRDSIRYHNKTVYGNEVALIGTFYNYYKSKYNTEVANEVYLELKDFETKRFQVLYIQNPSFRTYFKWKVNQFLKLFSDYGTEPSKAIVFSLYVILIFALIYLFFPNSWDKHGKNRIVDRYNFFFKYMKRKAGIHEVYLDEQRDELMSYDQFKENITTSEQKVPKFFTATALPLYKWAISGTKLSASLLKRVDIMKGSWNELPKGKRIWKSILLIGAFTIAVVYDIFIKMLNALMLSINTFTTLGFGEIPIKGLPRYLAIIQGFIGWFMLTIFSVSLISQLLN